MSPRLKTLGALGLLGLALPVNLGVTAAALAAGAVRPPPPVATARRPRTVMLSGGKMTKALQLARSFHEAGHRVVLVETARYRLTGHRFSRAVDAFHVVPDPADPSYADALLDVVRREGVDVYVPVCSPVSSRYDALAKAALSAHCEVVHLDPDDLEAVDDKAAFAGLATSLGLAVPRTDRLTDPEQVVDVDFDAPERAGRRWVLKNIAYDPVNRLDLTPLPRPTAGETAAFARSKPISEANPWLLQELVVGTEYCTHGTARDGRLTVWACCESSPFQVNYTHVQHPAIEEWVSTLVAARGLTGQVSFDFLEEPSGRVVAIECNPRTHSAITMFHRHPDLAAAYLGELGETEDRVEPLPGYAPTYWTYHEAWRVLSDPRRLAERWRVVRAGRDAIWDPRDPLPFLLVHHLQVPLLLLRALVGGRDWIRVDFNIGKLVEVGGD